MLEAAPLTTILPVKDMDRARRFYAGVLGLTPRGFAPDGNYVFGCAGGAQIALIVKPEGTKAEHTAVSFAVQQIEACIADLQRRGVVFEEYDLPGLRTVNHLCVLGSHKAAWFKDPEGNYLCLHEDS